MTDQQAHAIAGAILLGAAIVALQNTGTGELAAIVVGLFGLLFLGTNWRSPAA